VVWLDSWPKMLRPVRRPPCASANFALDEHAAGPAAGVKDAAFVRFYHFDEELDDGLRSVKLAALFSLGGCELAEEVFVDAAENVLGAAFPIAETNRADEVDEFAESVLVERFSRVVLR